MDSTSLSFPIASSDALMSTTVVVSEDEGCLSIASGLAKESGMLFQAGKYVDCLRVINQLLQRKEDDPKVFSKENGPLSEQKFSTYSLQDLS